MPGVVQHTRGLAAQGRRGGRRGRASAASCCSACPPTRTRPAPAAIDPDGILNVGAARRARRGRRRHRGHGGHVPGRVHRPRPLRGARRATGGSTTTRPWSVYAAMAVAQAAGRRAPGRPQRDDGRPGRRDPGGAGRRRPHRRRRSSPTRRSTRSAFYGPFREAVDSQLQRRPARPTSRTRPMRARRCARPRWTSPRAPTS